MRDDNIKAIIKSLNTLNEKVSALEEKLNDLTISTELTELRLGVQIEKACLDNEIIDCKLSARLEKLESNLSKKLGL